MARSTKIHRITVNAITKAFPPCILDDGGGLQLVITSATARKWTMRYTFRGTRRMMGLGKYPNLTLDAARDLAAKVRRQVGEGLDPHLERQAEKGKGTTFRDAFNTFFAHKKKTLSNKKHIAQWESTMETYVFPFIGDDSVATTGARQIIEVLSPIWHEKPETASRVLQRMNCVFEAAIVLGERKDANPCTGVTKILGTIDKDVRHYPSLHYSKAPAFIQRLRKSRCQPITKLAFEFLILTVARSGQVREAPAAEVNPRTGLWVIPPERMKAGRQHIVPLPPRALEIYHEARKLTGDTELLFPAQSGKPLSDMTFNKILRDWKMDEEAVAHGFRATFKTWCSEVEKVREVVSEFALAHVDQDKVREAYQRADFLDERKELMKRWERFLNRTAGKRSKTRTILQSEDHSATL